MTKPITPIIMGIPSTEIDSETRAIIEDINPAGFILFKRNCQTAEQVEALCAELHSLSPLESPLICIDQEGGRVVRMDWLLHVPPEPRVFGHIYNRDKEKGVKAAMLNGYVMAASLRSLGITVNNFPLGDIAIKGADKVVGDRSFSNDPSAVSALCAASISGQLAGGVWPVIKHAPGHGRAKVDSHKDLPVVTESEDVLEMTDFLPFQLNAECPFVMTAHVKYTALDDENCATQSEEIIKGIIRGQLGMEGVVIADDIAMGALEGSIRERAEKSLNAGCDLLLFCGANLEGKFDSEIYSQISTLKGLEINPEALERLKVLPTPGTPNSAKLVQDAMDELEVMLIHD